jgi:hypothetical protein
MTDIPGDDKPINDSRLGSRGGAVKRCVDCGDLIAVYATRFQAGRTAASQSENPANRFGASSVYFTVFWMLLCPR